MENEGEFEQTLSCLCTPSGCGARLEVSDFVIGRVMVTVSSGERVVSAVVEVDALVDILIRMRIRSDMES